MIDFGLANSQPVVEDKAVDLNVLERAFHSTHVHAEPLVNIRILLLNFDSLNV